MAAHRYTCVGFSPKIDWKTIEFLLPMPVYRICSVCSVLPDMIFSLECGHVFCPACMSELTQNSPAVRCPFDQQTFEDERVSRDSSSQEYVAGCKSYCLNKTSGCNHVGPVSEMIEHYYSECVYHVVQCRSCKNPVARLNVLAHLRGGCSSTDVLTAQAADVAPTAVGSDVDLSAILSKIENLENVILTRTNGLERMLRRQCRRSRASSRQRSRFDVGFAARHDNGGQHDDSDDSGTATPSGTASTPEPEEAAPTPVVNGVATADSSTSEESQDQATLEPPPSNVANGEPEAEEEVTEAVLEPAESALTNSAAQNPRFTHIWEVKPFRKFRNTPSVVFRSDVVTVGENGYRIRLEGKFNGVGDSQALYLGLYLRLQRGPNDASLAWPFKRNCSFVLLHSKQHNRNITFRLADHLNVEEMQNAANTSLKRPRQGENDDAFGIDKCVTVQHMLQAGFVKNNVFKVQFVAE
ncbi:hypothetical protein HPB48_015051 [Haemaphysalis longicornis]|uniref:Tnf receptor-associated factor n=1 Tax=Haemaphysalis longicornis TaxID=44386 RepID=A0A9J6FLE7_HAELO|nr:hypothetical protein HPB48_015051 [Haemaphysalis longicornis]